MAVLLQSARVRSLAPRALDSLGQVHGPAPTGESLGSPRGVTAAGKRSCVASAVASTLIVQAARWRQRRRFVLLRRAAPADAEDAATLAAEAARIRAEAEAMQREADSRRRKLQAMELLQGASSLTSMELQGRLKETVDISLSDSEVQRLLKLMGISDSSRVSREQLESAAFQAALKDLQQEQAEAEQKLKEELVQKVAVESTQEPGQMPSSDWIQGAFAEGSPGDDRSWAIRIAAMLGYLLPLIDSLPYGFPIASMAPFTVPVFNALLPLYMVKDAIPFGTFIFILLLSALSRNPSFPRLLQFNWQQAVVMDVLAIMPSFIIGLLGLDLPEDLLLAAFVILVGSVTYCAIWTALGREPDSLGFISDATKRNLGRF